MSAGDRGIREFVTLRHDAEWPPANGSWLGSSTVSDEGVALHEWSAGTVRLFQNHTARLPHIA
ncbi:hypothetical protein N7478_012524 [Penicillium angulare]|uniref:uncharacterized protein n=1 Tax=Penicillium angulare TaxID=116970 RepID=UPI0025414A50|nr:uncharacterized protein N7478_012524 [Penicillium angulare]KAJ5259543.1 hypothetical protein N7478_012524 [Penicillium angulare]